MGYPSKNRKVLKLAEQRKMTAYELLKECYERNRNQHLMAQELGVSQGTVSREMLIHGLFDDRGYVPGRSR